jgi:uncharacterized protein (DUF58 family)
VTARGAAITVTGAALTVAGWRAGWPELTALGVAGLTLVVLVLLIAGRSPRAALTVSGQSFRVVRGEPASLPMTVDAGPRRRWLRLVEGPPGAPTVSLPVPARRVQSEGLHVPLDTAQRGRRPVGPYLLVHSDPWSIVRRVVAQADGGTLTVLPRTYPLRRSLLSTLTVDESELSSQRAGDQHFHALRDYVLGDEPRMIHWRSTARAGRLVVRQQVSAATMGTTVILDCDMSAYGSGERFGSGWLVERFEAAVEVAASLCVADGGRDEQVHLVTSRREATPLTAVKGATSALLDALAEVRAVAPVDTAAQRLPQLLRRLRSARTVIVTGSPGPAILEAAGAIRRPGTATALVRVRDPHPRPLPGLRVLDVDDAGELA